MHMERERERVQKIYTCGRRVRDVRKRKTHTQTYLSISLSIYLSIYLPIERDMTGVLYTYSHHTSMYPFFLLFLSVYIHLPQT